MSRESDDIQLEPELTKTDSKSTCFVNALKDYTIVNNRSNIIKYDCS